MPDARSRSPREPATAEPHARSPRRPAGYRRPRAGPAHGPRPPHRRARTSGEIAELGEGLEAPEGVETVDAGGAHLLPAFVDPHVHLRVPGQEHKEDIETGTRAAAAGGFCAIIGMPNTSPPIDSASVLRSVADLASVHARVPVGFLAAATAGQQGHR